MDGKRGLARVEPKERPELPNGVAVGLANGVEVEVASGSFVVSVAASLGGSTFACPNENELDIETVGLAPNESPGVADGSLSPSFLSLVLPNA